MNDKKLFGTATVGTKGQIVIPADARDAFGIEPGDRLYVVGSKSHNVVCLLQEEQLRAMVEQLTDNAEVFRGLLNSTPKNNEKE